MKRWKRKREGEREKRAEKRLQVRNSCTRKDVFQFANSSNWKNEWMSGDTLNTFAPAVAAGEANSGDERMFNRSRTACFMQAGIRYRETVQTAWSSIFREGILAAIRDEWGKRERETNDETTGECTHMIKEIETPTNKLLCKHLHFEVNSSTDWFSPLSFLRLYVWWMHVCSIQHHLMLSQSKSFSRRK